MIGSLRSALRSAFMTLAARLEPDRRREARRGGETPGNVDSDDIDRVVDTFRQLMSKLSRDGNELGELYARAERRAARFALLSKTVVESVSSGILVVERSRQVGLINSSAERLLGADAGQDAVGLQLADLFADAGGLEGLVGECFRTGEDSSRNVVSVVGLDGSARQFGASISCLKSGSDRTEAVIIVFAEIGTSVHGISPPDEGERSELEHQDYLRGVLDAHDLLSPVLGMTDRIRSRANRGRLEISDLQRFSGELGRTCDLMTAFALSGRAPGALTELVDVNSMIESILRRRNLCSAPHITKNLQSGLPGVKTVGKILEMGLEMLVVGCMEASPGGIEVITGLRREGGTDLAGIAIRERSITRPITEVGSSLRDFLEDGDLRREVGLMLLRALPPDSHRVKAEKLGDFFNFSIGILVPISSRARPSVRGGDAREGRQDEG
jgi:hypothetical protein